MLPPFMPEQQSQQPPKLTGVACRRCDKLVANASPPGTFTVYLSLTCPL